MIPPLLALLLAACAFHVPPPAAGEPAALAFSLVAEDPERLYVKVDDALWFVDTGASRTTCDDDWVAAQGLPARWVPAWSRGRVGTVPVRRTMLRDVEVGGWTFTRLPCAVRDLGETSSLPDDPRIAGVLGANVFRHFVVELDFRYGRMALREGGRDAGTPLTREWGLGPRLLVEVDVDGERVLAVVDTGASHTHLPLTTGPVVRHYRGTRRGTGPGGRMQAEVIVRGADEVRIADQELPIGGYVQTDRAPGLLGLDALDVRLVEVDFVHRRLRLEPWEELPTVPDVGISP